MNNQINKENNIKIEKVSLEEKELRTFIKDKFGNPYNEENISKPLFSSNFVNIKEIDAETGKLRNEEQSKNLILYRGRTWLLQRAANLNLGMSSWNDATSSHPYPVPNYRDSFISWFALGYGGHYEQDLFRIKGVKNTDYDLTLWAKNIPDDGINSNESMISGNILYYKVKLDNNNYIWRQYHKISSLEILTDAELKNTGTYKSLDEKEQYKNNKVDSYIVLKVSTVIQSFEYNTKNSFYEGQILSEAGLFVSNTGTSVPDYPPVLIAKTYFPAKLKDSGTVLIFDWYIYF